MQEKESKKQKLGDIMDRYNERMENEQRNLKQLDHQQDHPKPQPDPPRPIQLEQPPGAQYAQYRPSHD